MTQYGFKKKAVDLVELSDAFRRHATYRNPELVAKLVKEARWFAATSTNYDGGYPQLGSNDDVDSYLIKCLKRISDIAVQLGIEKITLPVDGDRRSWNARRIQKNVLKDIDLPVRFVLQDTEYNRDLSHVGPINWRFKTALNEGIRGVAKINDRLKMKWDHN